jgi:APA family basic amino acid/polyamine antiporter
VAAPRFNRSIQFVTYILSTTFFTRSVAKVQTFTKFSSFSLFISDYTTSFYGSLSIMMPENDGSAKDAEAGDCSKDAMPAEFGLGTATFVVIAGMVGAGILTTSGYTVAAVGSNQWMLFLWVLGGVMAVCGALSLAELTAALPRTGGDYVYLHATYGPLPAFLAGWVSFLIGFAGPSAASAFGFAQYILAPFPVLGAESGVPQRAVATAAILTFATIHVTGRRRTARVQGVITVIKLVGLSVFALAGLSIGWPRRANLADGTPIDGDLLVKLMSSMVYIYYAYTGWNSASYLAGEVREPQRRLPQAILLGTTGVTVLYVALNVVYALALSVSDVHAMLLDPSNQKGLDAVAPIAQLAGSRLFGAQWTTPLSVAFGLVLLSTLSAYVLIGPRVVYAMARAGQFPAVAARLTRGAGTPAVATSLQVGVALVLLWTGTFESLIVYSGVGMSIFSMLAISSIYVLRRTRPDLPRPFRTPGYPVTPAVYLILTGLLTAATFFVRTRIALYAVVSIAAGIPVYYLWRHQGRLVERPAASP